MFDAEILHGAFHNSLIQWNLHKHHDIEEISNTAIGNRQKLNHVYLRQDSLHFKLWTMFGGFSLTTMFYFIVIILLVKSITPCSKLKLGHRNSPNIDPRRLEIEGRVVKDHSLTQEDLCSQP